MSHSQPPVIKIGQNFNGKNKPLRTAKPPRYAIEVKVLLKGNKEIVCTFPKVLVKRFSLKAKEQLDQPGIFTSDASKVLKTLELPVVAQLPPSNEALNEVAAWFKENTTNAHGILTVLAAKDDDLTAQIDLLAAAVTFDLVLCPYPLQRVILKTIKSRPVTGTEFISIWEHLPHNHLVVSTMVRLTKHFWREWQIPAEENEIMDPYMLSDLELKQLFFREPTPRGRWKGKVAKVEATKDVVESSKAAEYPAHRSQEQSCCNTGTAVVDYGKPNGHKKLAGRRNAGCATRRQSRLARNSDPNDELWCWAFGD